jgi:hypothetical protein
MASEENSVEDQEAKQEQLFDFQTTVFINISICHFSMGSFEKSVEMASRALMLKPNVKAFYRRSRAHAELGNFDKAV